MLWYAAANLLRSRRRTLSSILGVVLAVGFITGTLVAIDSSTRLTLDAILASVAYDYSINVPTVKYEELTADILAVPGVSALSISSAFGLQEVGTWDRPASIEADGLAVDPENLPARLADWGLRGTMVLPRGNVVLSEWAASRLNVDIGDVVYLRSKREEPIFVNLTVEGIILAPLSPVRPFPGSFEVYSPSFLAIHLNDVEWMRQQLGDLSFHSVTVQIWIDRDRFIDPFDMGVTRRNLGRFERELTEVTLEWGDLPYDNLSVALVVFEDAIAVRRTLFLFLSLPVVFLGLYLGAVGMDFGYADRRRELAVVKTRGAGGGQVFGLLIVEATIGGVLVAALGLAVGLGLSAVLMTAIASGLPSGPRYDAIFLSANTILVTVVLSVAFMAIVSHRSAKRTAGLPMVEALRHHAPGETEIGYRPTADAALLVLGLAIFAAVLFAHTNPGGIFSFLLGPASFALIPFAPVFLIVGLTRLLTRSTGRVYEWASRLFKPLARNLHHIVSRNLLRNPRRSSNMAVIIALGVAFGIFTLSVLASQLAWYDRQLRASIGADMSLVPPADDPNFSERLLALPDVAYVTKVARIRADVFPADPAVFAIEPATFFTVTRPEPWYFEGGDVDLARRLLARSGFVLVSKRYFEDAFLEIGDTLTIRAESYDETSGKIRRFAVEVRVGGVVRGLPGMPSGFAGFDRPSAIYGSFEMLGVFLSGFRVDSPFRPTSPERGGDTRYLVDLDDSVDWRAAKEAVLELGAFDVRVYEEEREQAAANPLLQSLLGFIYVEVAFAVVIVTGGLALVTYTASLERRGEFAGVVARGASGLQVAGLLLGESLSIMLIGLAIGTGAGLATSFAATQVLFIGPPGTPEPFVPFLFELPVEVILLTALAAAAMVLAALVISWRIARMNVAKVLKQRGG
jgi:putative ABC transport system permease protein